MDLTYASILVLAAMVFVVSGMVGYLYWQHTRLQQHVQSLSLVVTSLVTPAPVEETSPEVPQPVTETETEAEVEVEEDAPVDEDDRLSVEHVTAPPVSSPKEEVDIDDLQTKTAVQLRELLTQKGIPFGKRDSKSALIELLKATA
jgi:hypothetical protein